MATGIAAYRIDSTFTIQLETKTDHRLDHHRVGSDHHTGKKKEMNREKEKKKKGPPTHKISS